MKSIRKRNPLLFDLLLFIAFSLASFGAYLLTQSLGSTGAMISIAALALICIGLVISR